MDSQTPFKDVWSNLKTFLGLNDIKNLNGQSNPVQRRLIYFKDFFRFKWYKNINGQSNPVQRRIFWYNR